MELYKKILLIFILIAITGMIVISYSLNKATNTNTSEELAINSDAYFDFPDKAENNFPRDDRGYLMHDRIMINGEIFEIESVFGKDFSKFDIDVKYSEEYITPVEIILPAIYQYGFWTYLENRGAELLSFQKITCMKKEDIADGAFNELYKYRILIYRVDDIAELKFELYKGFLNKNENEKEKPVYELNLDFWKYVSPSN